MVQELRTVIVYVTKKLSLGQKKTMTLNVNSGVVDPNVAGSPDQLNPLDMASSIHILGNENNAVAQWYCSSVHTPQYVVLMPHHLYQIILHANGGQMVLC
jgi:ABC-type antimicrobial peptide transport system ATPase subunit